jgi:hypothetical protein
MVKPSKLKAEFRKVEKENYAFRTFLKNHADPDQLDEQFLQLHKELFENYDCNQCRNCCKDYSASFEKGELAPVAAFIGMSENEFINKYILEEYGDYQMKTKPCFFLKEDGGCTIETCKPASCRDYPFTNQPERLFSLLSLVDSTSVCPVVFEMFERLKQIYKFKRR